MHSEDTFDFFLCFGADFRVFILIAEAEPMYRRICCRAGAGCGRASHGAGEGADVQFYVWYGKHPHIPVSGAGQCAEHYTGGRVCETPLKVFNAGIAAVIDITGVDFERSGAFAIRMQIPQVKYPVVEFGFCVRGSGEEEYMVVTRIPRERLLLDTIAEPSSLILTFRFLVFNDMEYRAQIQVQPVTHLQQGGDGCGGWALVHIVDSFLGDVDPLGVAEFTYPSLADIFFLSVVLNIVDDVLDDFYVCHANTSLWLEPGNPRQVLGHLFYSITRKLEKIYTKIKLVSIILLKRRMW